MTIKEEQIRLTRLRIKQALAENKDGLTRNELIEMCGGYVPEALNRLIKYGEVEREKLRRNVYYLTDIQTELKD